MSNPLHSLTLASLLSLSFGIAAQAEEVMVFAAASMKNGLDELAAKFEQETGHKVVVSYAGSNALAKQILEGAPADIFISAAENWMDEVEKSGLIADDSRKDLLGNTLVLIAHGKDVAPVELGADFDLKALLGEEKLAMALVDSVPAGQYGKAALEHLGQWQAIEPSVAQNDNVRATLALVAQGEAPYGIVYATDAAADDNVSVIATFPSDSHPAITYPAALLTGAADPADTAFFEALSGEEADKIFAAEGFAILN